MVSKQAQAKNQQGFQKDSPKCSNCYHFTLERYTEKSAYGTFDRERNMRCKMGGFKVGKSNWCQGHTRKPSPS